MRPPKRLELSVIGLAACLAMAASEANVVTVVSAKSPITALSKTQIADIFLGKSNRFPDGAQATPIDQPEASSVREEFYDKVTGKSLAQLKAHWSKIIFTGRGRPPKTASSSRRGQEAACRKRAGDRIHRGYAGGPERQGAA
jgi:ABC-type phosphate transport system substrate-binding protein